MRPGRFYIFIYLFITYKEIIICRLVPGGRSIRHLTRLRRLYLAENPLCADTRWRAKALAYFPQAAQLMLDDVVRGLPFIPT